MSARNGFRLNRRSSLASGVALLCIAAGCLGRPPMQGAYPYGPPQFVTLPGPISSPPLATPVPISTPQPSPPPGPVASPPHDEPLGDGGLSLTPASRSSASTAPRYPVWQSPPRTFAPSPAAGGYGPVTSHPAHPHPIGNTSYSRPIDGDSRPTATPAAYSAENSAALPATPDDDLKHRGGKTIRDLTYINIYVGGPQVWAESDRKNIDWALNAAMTDPHLNHVMMQYFNDQPITSNYRGSFLLNGYAPTRVTQGNMQQLVRSLDQMGSFSQLPAGNAAINFILPRGVVLEDPSLGTSQPANPIPSADEGNSLQGLAGYHGSARIGARTLYYAVGVYSERLPNGQTNGVPVFEVPWKDICATLYHQLQEIRTDPDSDDAISSGNQKYAGWVSDRGEEISDLPVKADSADGRLDQVFREVPLANGSARVPVQFMYSNAVHGPEGPIAQPHAGSPLPVPPATVPPWGSSPGPAPDPTPDPDPEPNDPPPQTADPGLEWIRKEWANLPDSLKKRILEMIQQSQANAEEQPFGS